MRERRRWSWRPLRQGADAGAAGHVRDLHGASVQVDEPAGDGQTETAAAVRGGAGGVGAGEALEHALAIGAWDAGAVVGDGEPDVAATRRGRDSHGAVRR